MLGADAIYKNLTESYGFDTIVKSATVGGTKITDLAISPLALVQLSYGVTLRKLTEAYTVFPGEGKLSSGRSYILCLDSAGKRLVEKERAEKRIHTAECAQVMNGMLSRVVELGTASKITLDNLVDTAGKTGTSASSRDKLFVGYTPYYTAGIWCGYGDNTRSVTGSGHLDIWDSVMKQIHENKLSGIYAPRSFSYNMVARVAYCKDTSVGITVPYWVEYHVSEDGETYKQMGYSEINPDEAISGVNWYGLDFDASTRYVQLKVFSYGWAFLGEIEVYGTGTAPVDPPAEEPAEEHTINVSHVNAYSWGEFYSFVITEVGKNCTNNSTFQYACDWWYAIKVVDDTVTAIEGPGTAKTMMVEEGGFILYTYSNRADDWAAASKVEVGDVLLSSTADWSADAASETAIGTLTFGPAVENDKPETPATGDSIMLWVVLAVIMNFFLK